MKTVVYCEECLAKISEFGEIPSEAFIFICSEYFSGLPLEISTHRMDGTKTFLEILKFLEQKGLVVSTESSKDLIRIKPLGFRECEDESVCKWCLHE